MIDVFLDQQVVAGRIPPLAATAADFLLHGHCHQKAEFGTAAIQRHFARLPRRACAEVDSGCCGMAGSFGYEHYDLSRQVGEDRLFPAVRPRSRGADDDRLRHQLPAPAARLPGRGGQALGGSGAAGGVGPAGGRCLPRGPGVALSFCSQSLPLSATLVV